MEEYNEASCADLSEIPVEIPESDQVTSGEKLAGCSIILDKNGGLKTVSYA